MKLILRLVLSLAVCGGSALIAESCSAAEQGAPEWIWTAGDLTSAKTAYFRQEIKLSSPTDVTIDITADNSYELYVNGDLVGSGDNWQYVKQFNITKRVQRGKNVIAVKATNDSEGSAGLLVRVLVEQGGGGDVIFVSNGTWKSTDEPQSDTAWTALNYNAANWKPVHVLGAYPDAEPWKSVTWASKLKDRFLAAEGFKIEKVAGPDVTGTLINMCFDGKGRIIASQERGPLLMMIDSNGDGEMDKTQVVSDDIKNCQGVFAFDDTLLCAGEGPDGVALYRLSNPDSDGKYKKTETVQIYDAKIADHGPHAILLGPDGFLYNVMGNHANIKGDVNPDSPHRDYYEGDLLPKYEDARGHARGKKAPAGLVYRLNQDGTDWNLVAGGFRNEFDMAFNEDGELFTFDSDMEWDVGLPWYRPVRINHVVPGGEFGWRSGASKWPDYYFDSLPSTVDIGRGSPTGVCFYHNDKFPERYRDTFFVADWSQGKILAIHQKQDGSTYKGEVEEFVTGNPLNVSDIVPGPDGDLYFCLGGRGTEGGIYRVTPEKPGTARQPKSKSPVERALALPQPSAAWTRAKVKKLEEDSGSNWRSDLTKVAADPNRSVADRRRAVGILQQFSDGPPRRLLTALANDDKPQIRALALTLLAIHIDDEAEKIIVQALGDSDPVVRRRACEALIRANKTAPVEVVLPMLAEQDRFARYAARELLQRLPAEQWADAVLTADDPRIAAAGMLALVINSPTAEQNEAILKRSVALLRSDLPPADALDVLRVAELALQHEGTTEASRSNLSHAALQLFPSPDNNLNRELARVLAYLQESRAIDKLITYLQNSTDTTDQIHAVYCLRFIPQGWKWDQQAVLFEALNRLAGLEGGASFRGYLENMTRDYLASQQDSTRVNLFAHAAEFPMPTRLMLEALSAEQATAFSNDLIKLDQQLAKAELAADARAQIASAIVDALGRSTAPETKDYLRKLFEEQPDRREGVARALARQADKASFAALVATLQFGDKGTLQAVIRGLLKIDAKPEKPQDIRTAIIAGLKVDKNSRKEVVRLLNKWSGQEVAEESEMGPFQSWFIEEYPDLPAAELPKTAKKSKWEFDQILKFVTDSSSGGKGDAAKGEAIFEKAQCIKCHRFGQRGEGLGPDLSAVRKRFQRKQIVESLFYPSAVISDQYQSVSIITNEGLTHTGLAVEQGDAYVVLSTDGTKTTVKKSDVDEIVASNTSGMPEGLLDALTLAEIADLFAFLETTPAGIATKK